MQVLNVVRRVNCEATIGGETKSAHRILVKDVPGDLSLEDQEPEETVNL